MKVFVRHRHRPAPSVPFGAAHADEPTLRVTVDKAEVVKVDGAASVVLVANPQIADVVVERNHLVFVVGKRPGETRLYIYSAGGKRAARTRDRRRAQGDRSVTVIRDTQPTSYSCDPRCTAAEQLAAPLGPVVPRAREARRRPSRLALRPGRQPRRNSRAISADSRTAPGV